MMTIDKCCGVADDDIRRKITLITNFLYDDRSKTGVLVLKYYSTGHPACKHIMSGLLVFGLDVLGRTNQGHVFELL